MGFLRGLFGGGAKDAGEGIKSAGEGVKTVLDSGGGFLVKIRTALTGVDATSKAKIEELMTEFEGQLQEGRQKIEEIITMAAVQHKNPFVAVFLAGWRPFIGWIAGFSLAAYFLPQYIMGSIIWTRSAWLAMPYMKQAVIVNGTVIKAAELIVPQIPVYPVSADGLMELVGGLIGLAIMRSADKYAGTHNRH